MISVSIKNSDNVKRHIARMWSRAKSPGPAMASIAQKGERDVIGHFKEQSGPNGKWPMPKPSTLRARANRSDKSGKRKSSSILRNIDTGFLRSHIKSKSTSTEAHIFSGEVYAAAQNFGDSSKNIKPAPFMWIHEPAKQSMLKTLINYILGS